MLDRQQAQATYETYVAEIKQQYLELIGEGVWARLSDDEKYDISRDVFTNSRREITREYGIVNDGIFDKAFKFMPLDFRKKGQQHVAE